MCVLVIGFPFETDDWINSCTILDARQLSLPAEFFHGVPKPN